MPVFIIVPLLIKADSVGPVLFRQKRMGKGGKVFTIYKFRTMQVNSADTIHKEYVTGLIKKTGHSENGIYKIQKDPRVTRVGKFLRKTSLDEIPQFINVLKGDMSLVGPRPAIPYEIAAYEVWHLRRVMECKPGITGLWQTEGRSKTDFAGMVRMDLKYIQNQSLWLDIKIIIKTPWVLLTTRGAY